ncbi:MAG: kinase [Spirochaetes bacterium]|nr:MAG: kinase [Spirochaetota bacterium]
MQPRNPEPYVLLVGGANLDILGISQQTLIPRDSNPGRVKFHAGGVVRNIAENLSRLGIQTELIIATGSGMDGQFIRESCRSAGISLEHALILKEEISSTYMAMMDSNGDMSLALSDMSTSAYITAEYLQSKKELIALADIIVADTNLNPETLEYLTFEFPDSRLCIDPVSVTKAIKIIPFLSRIHTLKMNRLEAESICGFQVESPEDFKRAGKFLLNKGVQHIFITSGRKGIYWAYAEDSGFFTPPAVPVINATGAGDAFTAGVVFSILQEYSIEETLKFSTALAGITISGEAAVSSEVSRGRVREFSG